jgi:hypothetical protein
MLIPGLSHSRTLAALCCLHALLHLVAARAQNARMEIVLERRVGRSVQITNPQHVFRSGDFVRFRFKPSFDGYLYVMDKATSGKLVSLFPGRDGNNSNQVLKGRDYVIPSLLGSWFRIDNPPGYETVYFLVSPAQLTNTTAPPATNQPPLLGPAPAMPSNDLLPRCDDAAFEARGECLDTASGPRTLPLGEDLPQGLPQIPGSASRDITIINKSGSSVVAPDTTSNSPVIYEFRLAHR